MEGPVEGAITEQQVLPGDLPPSLIFGFTPASDSESAESCWILLDPTSTTFAVILTILVAASRMAPTPDPRNTTVVRKTVYTGAAMKTTKKKALSSPANTEKGQAPAKPKARENRNFSRPQKKELPALDQDTASRLDHGKGKKQTEPKVTSKNSKRGTKEKLEAKSEPIVGQTLEQNDLKKTAKFIAVSPNVFRKERNLSGILQTEIRVPSKTRKRSVCFDPTYVGMWPTQMDIPHLYTLKRTYEPMENQKLSPMSKYKYVRKSKPTLALQSRPRYVFVKRPKTPKNFLPRPKSSNRYEFVSKKDQERYRKGSKGPCRSVFKPKTRYLYRPKSGLPQNFRPRPKSSRRFERRYKFPAGARSLVRNITRYSFKPRPRSARNYLPRPKSSNRYVPARIGSTEIISDQMNPYEKKSVIRPLQRYVKKIVPEEESIEVKKIETMKRIVEVFDIAPKEITENINPDGIKCQTDEATPDEVMMETTEEENKSNRNVEVNVTENIDDHTVPTKIENIIDEEIRTNIKEDISRDHKDMEVAQDSDGAKQEKEKTLKEKTVDEKKDKDEVLEKNSNANEKRDEKQEEKIQKENTEKVISNEKKKEAKEIKSESVPLTKSTSGWGDPEVVKMIENTKTGWILRSH